MRIMNAGRVLIMLCAVVVVAPALIADAGSARDFEVRITLYVMGTQKKTAHTVTNRRIRKSEFLTGDGTKKTVLDRQLKPAEAAALSSFMAAFPLAKLKPSYVTKSVRGEGHLAFDIRVGRLRRSITVSFFKQPDLWELAKRINALLPDDQALFYGRD